MYDQLAETLNCDLCAEFLYDEKEEEEDFPCTIVLNKREYKLNKNRALVKNPRGVVKFYGELAVKFITKKFVGVAEKELIANIKLHKSKVSMEFLEPVFYAATNKKFFIHVTNAMSCDVHDILKSRGQKAPVYNDVLLLIQCVAKALFVLDSLKLVHNDIKLENIVWDSKLNVYKLIDFDTLFETGIKVTTGCGTVGCKSLQKLQCQELTLADDIWSLSIVIYEVITAYASMWLTIDDFTEKNKKTAIKRMQTGMQGWNKNQMETIMTLFTKMNEYEVEKRISINDILSEIFMI